jgi:uncharacterized protein YaeQ
MALTATMYTLAVQLSDSDRGVYETLDLRVARQPSETAEYMVMRVLAYCLEYTEGIEFTEGVASGDEPAVLVRDLTGKITAWIEVGMPAAARLHKGSKQAERTAVYTHREVRQVLSQLQGEKIHRAAEIPIISFERGFVEELAARLDRRTALSLTVTGGHLYVEAGGHTLSSAILEQKLA